MKWGNQQGPGEELCGVLEVGSPFLAAPSEGAELLLVPFEVQNNAHPLDGSKFHFRRTRCLTGRSTTSSIVLGGRPGNNCSNSASASRAKAIFTRLSREIFPLVSNSLSDAYETFALAASSRWVSPKSIRRRFIRSARPPIISAGDNILNAIIVSLIQTNAMKVPS